MKDLTRDRQARLQLRPFLFLPFKNEYIHTKDYFLMKSTCQLSMMIIGIVPQHRAFLLTDLQIQLYLVATTLRSADSITVQNFTTQFYIKNVFLQNQGNLDTTLVCTKQTGSPQYHRLNRANQIVPYVAAKQTIPRLRRK